MLHFKDVQRELGEQHANAWEEVWYSLAVADACRAGVPLTDCHWSEATSAGDGGIDFEIKRGAQRSGAQFIPATPSVWSIKSGSNATQAATLKAELNPILSAA